MGVRAELSLEIKRRQIRQRVDDGYKLSRIAKDTGISYRHVKTIAVQYEDEKQANSVIEGN